MIAILCPSKSQETIKEFLATHTTSPIFNKQANELAKKLANLNPTELGNLMNISKKLVNENVERFHNWNFSKSNENKRPALFTFNGGVYSGLDAYSFSKQEIERAQDTLRILSGIYGVIRPLDLIQTYRLEMGTKWAIDSSTKNLYDYWGDLITKQLNKDLEETKSNYLIDLASKEYTRALNLDLLEKPLIDIVFKDEKNGKLRIVAIYAKMARGAMANFIVKTRAKTLNDLKLFTEMNYAYDENLSSDSELVFTR